MCVSAVEDCELFIRLKYYVVLAYDIFVLRTIPQQKSFGNRKEKRTQNRPYQVAANGNKACKENVEEKSIYFFTMNGLETSVTTSNSFVLKLFISPPFCGGGQSFN